MLVTDEADDSHDHSSELLKSLDSPSEAGVLHLKVA
jgi:hypothetical protein